jgi:hypothetical protein
VGIPINLRYPTIPVRQAIPIGLLSSRAQFRFTCRDKINHSKKKCLIKLDSWALIKIGKNKRKKSYWKKVREQYKTAPLNWLT